MDTDLFMTNLVMEPQPGAQSALEYYLVNTTMEISLMIVLEEKAVYFKMLSTLCISVVTKRKRLSKLFKLWQISLKNLAIPRRNLLWHGE